MVTCAKLQQWCQSSLYRELSELIRAKAFSQPAPIPIANHFLASAFFFKTYLITLSFSCPVFLYARHGGGVIYLSIITIIIIVSI